MRRMIIEAVTVCAKGRGKDRSYADIFAETLPINRAIVDRLLVVTDPTDVQTLDLCHQHNCEAIVTEEHWRDGDDFNKGRIVERGLALLEHADWLLHLDSDIALPSDFRESLDDADLDPRVIYGADRLMVVGADQWDRLRSRGSSSRAWHCYQSTLGLPVGARWTDVRFGYVPIGYFQLWHRSADHRKGIRLRRYPDKHQDAARADVQFALQWDRRHRQLIPELYVAHLESEPSATGTNWKGRRTRPFRPNCVC